MYGKCLLFGVLIFIQVKNIVCQPEFGSIFPIPLTEVNDDPNFLSCPKESGAYTHTTNCSVFHMCTFQIHAIYSCIDGFFFNPMSGKCQYLPVKDGVNCAEIVKKMTDIDLFPLAEPVKGYDYYHRRKSATSECTQAGIYPDVLDCSLFHYCHQNKQHEILKCPKGLNFDPKLYVCSTPQLVNCQYEPPAPIEDETDSPTTLKSNTICRDYAPGTHLPVAHEYDQFIICGNHGESTKMRCRPGSYYNALTTNCEMKPCTKNFVLCKNNGQCIDEPTDKKGFMCKCSIQFQGEYCEKRVQLTGTTKKQMDTSTQSQVADRLTEHNQSETTEANVVNRAMPYTDPKIEDKISVPEKVSTSHSPLSRIVHRLYHNYDQEQIDEMIKIIFVTVLFLIGLVLLGSILFGIAFCIRLLLSPPIETVGTWKILPEESKV